MNSVHTVIVCATFTIKKARGNPFTNNSLFAYEKYVCQQLAPQSLNKATLLYSPITFAF